MDLLKLSEYRVTKLVDPLFHHLSILKHLAHKLWQALDKELKMTTRPSLRMLMD
jgi:hypothetical protein